MDEVLNIFRLDTINMEYVLIIWILTVVIYGLTFFYLINSYVKIDNVYYSKKLLKELSIINKQIDIIIANKKIVDYINTNLNTVLNYSKDIYGKKEIYTISFDKFNNTISIISPTCNNIYTLYSHMSLVEIKYIEDSLLNRVTKR